MITYRKAEYKDMGTIAKLHIDLFPEYFLTSFGEKMVRDYYTEFFNENNLFVVAVDGDEIVGFVMGYLVGSVAKSKFEKEHAGALMRNLIVRCLKLEKQALSKCFARVKSMLKKVNNESSTDHPSQGADLLSICIKKEYRGQGIADTLFSEFETLLRKNNVKKYNLSVLKDNLHAQHCYERLGFVKCGYDETCFEYTKELSR